MIEHKSKRQIEEELRKILADHADWLLVKHKDSAAFIQFGLGFERSGEFDGRRIVVMDLPCKALTTEQQERAATIFAASDYQGPVEESYLDDADKPRWCAAWKESFMCDAEEAAAAALDRMQLIYGLPEGFDVTLETGRAE